MKKLACQYALLRFRPFIETGEFANVGVVLMAPETGFFDFHLLTRPGRVTKFFHQLDRKVYLNAMRLFKEELERFATALRRNTQQGAGTQLAQNLFQELVRTREAVLQFGEQRIVLADDAQAKLKDLFDFYVERNFVTKEYQERLLEGGIRHLLARAKIGADFKQKKIGTDDFAVTFPFVHMTDGRPERIIKPLFLGQEDSTKLLTHGGQWVDKVRRLRKRNVLPDDLLFPVKAPNQNAQPYASFVEIRDELRDEGVTVVAANDETSILRFAAQLESA